MSSSRCASALVACAIAWQAAAWGQVKGNEPLENTYWKLVRLGDDEVAAVPNQREAHFILHRATRHFSGAGGCNRMTGNYDVEGDRLTFDRVITTMMACAEGMESERKFLAALRQTGLAKVTQQQLELLDAEGKVIARLQAVHLK
jgi:heat shock protein HslJ